MHEVKFKVFIPFKFKNGASFSERRLTINEFHIDDIKYNLHFNENDDHKNYIMVTTQVEGDNDIDIDDEANIKVGKALQLFFDGISKAKNNSSIYNIFNGDSFNVKYEYIRGSSKQGESPDHNPELCLDDSIIDYAIRYANLKDEFISQAFIYLKEGEYLIDIGRFESSILQYAIMIEFLINYQLRKQGYLNKDGEYKKSFDDECKQSYTQIHGTSNRVPFAYSKYVFGLAKLGLSLNDIILDIINMVYKIRNKLAHGYNLYSALKKLNYRYNNDLVDEKNVWAFMTNITIYMDEVFDFFELNFGEASLRSTAY